jgi:hypothetical protein
MPLGKSNLVKRSLELAPFYKEILRTRLYTVVIVGKGKAKTTHNRDTCIRRRRKLAAETRAFRQRIEDSHVE